MSRMRLRAAVTITLPVVALACGDDPNSLKRWEGGQAGTSEPTPRESAPPATTSTAPAPTTPAPAPTAPPTAPPKDGSVEQLCVDEINRYRATLGLAPYKRWSDGETCADGQAKSDGQARRAHGAFGQCKEFAQNECPGWPGPADKMLPGCLKMMWGEGPGGGHYENMRSTRYSEVSCGFHTMPDGSVWSVQNFK